jgi:cysteine synthase A
MGSRIYDGVMDLVGHTPLVRLNKVSPRGGAEICAKLEARNPGGSVKDRPALAMVLAAEERGELGAESTIVEATSGNTGISLAMIAAVRGYRCVLTPAEDGMAGAVERANQIASETKGAWMTRQFSNPANPDVHEKTTATEIWEATGGRLDALVAGVGTGGTITGVGRVLRAKLPGVKIVAVEPRASNVLSGGKPGLHGIQGLGAGFVPDVLDRSLVDEVVAVSDIAAERMMRRLSREEGLLVGPSSGANVHAALEVARTLGEGTRVVTILCDTGERYLC